MNECCIVFGYISAYKPTMGNCCGQPAPKERKRIVIQPEIIEQVSDTLHSLPEDSTIQSKSEVEQPVNNNDESNLDRPSIRINFCQFGSNEKQSKETSVRDHSMTLLGSSFKAQIQDSVDPELKSAIKHVSKDSLNLKGESLPDNNDSKSTESRELPDQSQSRIKSSSLLSVEVDFKNRAKTPSKKQQVTIEIVPPPELFGPQAECKTTESNVQDDVPKQAKNLPKKTFQKECLESENIKYSDSSLAQVPSAQLSIPFHQIVQMGKATLLELKKQIELRKKSSNETECQENKLQSKQLEENGVEAESKEKLTSSTKDIRKSSFPIDRLIQFFEALSKSPSREEKKVITPSLSKIKQIKTLTLSIPKIADSLISVNESSGKDKVKTLAIPIPKKQFESDSVREIPSILSVQGSTTSRFEGKSSSQVKAILPIPKKASSMCDLQAKKQVTTLPIPKMKQSESKTFVPEENPQAPQPNHAVLPVPNGNNTFGHDAIQDQQVPPWSNPPPEFEDEEKEDDNQPKVDELSQPTRFLPSAPSKCKKENTKAKVPLFMQQARAFKPKFEALTLPALTPLTKTSKRSQTTGKIEGRTIVLPTPHLKQSTRVLSKKPAKLQEVTSMLPTPKLKPTRTLPLSIRGISKRRQAKKSSFDLSSIVPLQRAKSSSLVRQQEQWSPNLYQTRTHQPTAVYSAKLRQTSWLPSTWQ